MKKSLILILLVLITNLLAQTGGKIKGFVYDENGNPLPGANIVVEGTTWGTETDSEGYYFILGVRVGTYTLRANFMGYAPREARNIRVRSGLTTSQNFNLSSSVVELETIGVEVVMEKRVEKDVTTSTRNIDLGNLEKLSFTQVEDILNATAGVKSDSEGELHFRGGRSGEVNYIIDGVSVGDPTGSKTNPLEINFANVESFNILKGVPDAEYGDALSGSVSMIMKVGDQEKTSGYAKYSTDSFLGKSKLDYQRGEFSLSGPVPIKINESKPTYYLGTDLTVQNGLSESYRIDGDPDGDFFSFSDHDLTGLGFKLPQKRENNFNLTLKLAYDISPTMKLSSSLLLSKTHGYEYDYFYRYTPQTATETMSDVTIVTLNWRHNINKRSYYDLIFSYFRREYESLPGGNTPEDFVRAEEMDQFVTETGTAMVLNDVKSNGVRDGGNAEGYLDNNQNGIFEREYYIDNSGSGYFNPDTDDVFIPFDQEYDSNLNGVWDGDILFDSNKNGKWDYWEEGKSYTGFKGNTFTDHLVEGYYDNNINGSYETNIYTESDEFPGTDEPFLDGDSFHDTGEPFVDQRKFYNTEIDGNTVIREIPNGIWDGETYTDVKIYTLRKNNELGIEEMHDDLRASDFQTRLNFHLNNEFYNADTLSYKISGVGVVNIDGIIYDLEDHYIQFRYAAENFADLKSSYNSATQGTPRINNLFNESRNGFFDEFEAYCSYRPFGESVNENDIGWKDNPDFYEYEGTYISFYVPKDTYDSLPNIKYLKHDEYSTWTNRNPKSNDTYDLPNGTYDSGEEFTDYNFDNTWNPKNGFLSEGFYPDGIIYSLLDNTVMKFKGSYTNQINKFHLVKTGFELVLNDFDYYSITNPYETYDTDRYFVSEDDPYPDRGREKTDYNYKPKEFSYFAQDKMEFEDLVINAGLRLDMRILDDKAVSFYEERALENFSGYEEEIEQVKAVVSPRLGISHSISETSKLFFSYGHLYQLPQYTLVFDSNTKAVDNPLFGNMNLGYERNVQYEVGIVNEVGDYLIDITGYFKNIFDMINTKTYQYALADDATVFSNSDYGKARGIELSIDKNLSKNYLWSLSYSYSYAYGKSSTQTSNFLDEKLIIKEFPLDWDERHTLNSYIAFVFDENDHLFGIPYTNDLTLSMSTDFGSGKPFTPVAAYYDENIDPAYITTNSERLPWTSNTDVKLTKSFGNLKFEFNIFNVFDKINVLSVYSDTGSWWKRSSTFYSDEENSSLTDIFKNPSNIDERRHYRFAVGYSW